MFASFDAYPWFLKVRPYENPAQLLVDLDRVIDQLRPRWRDFVGSFVAARRQLPAASRRITSL
jgi:hypothetical protein